MFGLRARPGYFVLLLGSLTLASATPAQVGRSDLPGSVHALSVMVDDERSGMAVFPARYAGSQPQEILDPAGYNVHLTDADRPGEELVFPAGKLFEPPAGRFRIWLEGNGRITPFTDLFAFRALWPKGGKILSSMPTVPAGLVNLAHEARSDPHLEFRVLFTGGDSSRRPRQELSRRKSVGQLGQGILMPQGPVVAALWDSEQERYVALSRPIVVRPNESVDAPLDAPEASVSHLVVYVSRPDDATSGALLNLELNIVQRSRERSPDHRLETLWGVYAFWYDLKPGLTLLQAGNEQLYLSEVRLKLAGGQIMRFERELSQRPFLRKTDPQPIRRD